MRIIQFHPSSVDRHFYQTCVYEFKAANHAVAYCLRMSPSQRKACQELSAHGILRHSSLVASKIADAVPVLDIRFCRLHKLLSALHDLYKYITTRHLRGIKDERELRLFLKAKKVIAKFLRRVTKRVQVRITNRKSVWRLTRKVRKHLPLVVLGLLKMSKRFGELLTVFIDIKYRLPAGASLVTALDTDCCMRFKHGMWAVIMSTRDTYCDWDIAGVDPWLRGLTTLKPEFI